MKRLPVLVTFLMFVALCASLSYWGLRLFKPQARAVAAVFQQGSYEPGAGQWGGIFGASQVMQASATNYQLKGIVLAKRTEQSLAIISANGKPALAVAMNKEVAPGVILKEVHDQYVMVSESGAMRRVDLPQLPELSRGSVQIPSLNPSGTVPPQVSPVAFPPPKRNDIPGGPVSSPAPPMVTPGMPTASLPATMPGGQ
ncbi:type II secretion system protein N [Undibacterium sp.]|uniref:type II secretion system protein N n=1 Tax=Undibacterium sp. TaxID=1914977 RepID=UPI002730ADE2|nr:type II secretion system protein N [Undibacterium sp.]MDP1979322.1 type II secretion system protein N [Undibacterium sp.]